jgi:uncharacterized membrane protein YeaQ/YmgE (transglycosylase-associated protein family)
MLERASETWHERSLSSAAYRVSDWRRLTLLLVCGFVAGIVASVVARTDHDAGVLPLVTAVAIVVGAFIVAAALLQFVDLIVLRAQVSRQTQRIASVNDATRRMLEARDPDVAARAARLDARELLDRSLRERAGRELPG